jgi:hypothetical protein
MKPPLACVHLGMRGVRENDAVSKLDQPTRPSPGGNGSIRMVVAGQRVLHPHRRIRPANAQIVPNLANTVGQVQGCSTRE